MKLKTISLMILVIAFLAIGSWYEYRTTEPTPEQTVINTTPSTTTEELPTSGGRYMDIQSYVKNNITTLAPIKESLGGTYYVTTIRTANGTGTVTYEDGHNSYVADFKYSIDTDGKLTVSSFVNRK